MSGAADEWLALLIFVGARCFADEHQLRPWIAHTENNLLASLLGQAAARAIADIFADGAKALGGSANVDPGLVEISSPLLLWELQLWLCARGKALALPVGSGLCFGPIEIINVKLIVVAMRSANASLELWVQGCGHENEFLLRVRSKLADSLGSTAEGSRSENFVFMATTLDPRLRTCALAERIRYYNELGIYDFYRREIIVNATRKQEPVPEQKPQP